MEFQDHPADPADYLPWRCWRDAKHKVGKHSIYGWPQCTVCKAAPQYFERGRYLPDNFRLNIYVPIRNMMGIFPASAIVGLPMGDRVQVYYEGWTHGAMQYEGKSPLDKWAGGLLHASDRMVTDYPTTAQAFLRRGDLHQVGSYVVQTRAYDITDERALHQWLGIQTEVLA